MLENTINRKTISKENIDKALKAIGDKTKYRLKEKSDGTMASRHDGLIIITEEFDELKDAVRSNDMNDFAEELKDIAVACHFAIDCIYDDSLDW